MSDLRPYHIIGVDGGGTGCRAAVCDSAGTVLGRASGGPANFRTDRATTLRNVNYAIETAAREAGIGPDGLARSVAHIGLAGLLTKEDARVMDQAVACRHVGCSDDRATSLVGALGPYDGLLAATGTGTLVAYRSGGRERYFGGWGLQVGDQASGAWLGRSALTRCLLAHDGLEERSGLSDRLLARFGGDPIAIVDFSLAAGPGDYAALAPEIVEAAQAKDPLANELMQRGADYLARCAEQAGMRDGEVVCLTGGLGPHYAAYLPDEIRSRLVQPQGTALDGAIRFARDALAKLEAVT